MPDNDRIYHNLNWRWSKSAEQLGEWAHSPIAIAHSTLMSLKKQIQHYGNPPVFLLKTVGGYFSTLESLSRAKDIFVAKGWISDQTHEVLRQHGGSKRGLELAKRVSVGQLNNLPGSSHTDVDHFDALTKSWVSAVYEADYVDIVSFAHQHYANATCSEIRERLAITDPYIMRGIDSRTMRWNWKTFNGR